MPSSADLQALRLRNLGLASQPFQRPVDVVRHLAAVQAQDYYGASWSLGQRMARGVAKDIDQALDREEILRTHVLRPTWHFVAPEDLRPLLALTAERVHQANGSMHRKLGLDDKTFVRSDAVIAAALSGGRSLERGELQAALKSKGIDADDGLRLAYFVMHAELEGIICSGPRRGKQFTYALLDERAPTGQPPDRASALVDLTRRFFETRGPASVEDFTKWSGLTKAEVRFGLETVREHFERIEIGGRPFWFSPDSRPERPGPPRAYLLSIYDEFFSSYQDHDLVASAGQMEKLRAMGNALTAIVVLDGRIAGTWRREPQKGYMAVELEFLTNPDAESRRVVMAAAERYGAFFELPVRFR